MMMIKL